MALSSWSNARLAAETVVVPVEESDLTGAASAVSAGAGGIILFGSAAPADLGAQISSLETAVPGRLGLLVMTDEEGGGVQRMANLVGSLPWPRVMSESWSPAQITANVASVARGMAAYGVSMDLAPVVDVDGRNVAPGAGDPDGWRAFGGDPSVVSTDGLAYAEGLLDGGVIPVLKHFPGLGGASGNTDNGPAATLPWSTLQTVGLPPFITGIAHGLPAIMVSNATVPGLTTQPASLSSTVIESELRGALHFRGLVITDSLSAYAILDAGYSVPDAAAQALRAGADMVLFSLGATPAATEQQFSSTVSAIATAVSTGSLARSRLLEAAAAALSVRHVATCP